MEACDGHTQQHGGQTTINHVQRTQQTFMWFGIMLTPMKKEPILYSVFLSLLPVMYKSIFLSPKKVPKPITKIPLNLKMGKPIQISKPYLKQTYLKINLIPN